MEVKKCFFFPRIKKSLQFAVFIYFMLTPTLLRKKKLSLQGFSFILDRVARDVSLWVKRAYEVSLWDKRHVTFHFGSSMWSTTLRPRDTWSFTLRQRSTWCFTLRRRGTWIFTRRPRSTSGFTQSKGHLKVLFVTNQHVTFESETKGHVSWTFTARQWVRGVGNLRGMLVLSVRIINEVYLMFVNHLQ